MPEQDTPTPTEPPRNPNGSAPYGRKVVDTRPDGTSY
jgi:hypothetical protein